MKKSSVSFTSRANSRIPNPAKVPNTSKSRGGSVGKSVGNSRQPMSKTSTATINLKNAKPAASSKSNSSQGMTTKLVCQSARAPPLGGKITASSPELPSARPIRSQYELMFGGDKSRSTSSHGASAIRALGAELVGQMSKLSSNSK